MLLSEWLGCRSLMSCIFAHEDADKAGHNGQCTDKKGSSGISGKHWVRCNEGYDPWIVRLGSADESDTLMKTRTRRGQDRQNKVFACYPAVCRNWCKSGAAAHDRLLKQESHRTSSG